MNKVDIMRMTLEHVEGVMVVENLSFSIPWSRDAFVEEITNNKLAIYFTAKIGDVIVGYAGMWKVYDEGHITNVAVHPEFRKNGIGQKLIQGLIDFALPQGITSMTLEVRTSNIAAQNLYKKFGFENAGIRKGYYADNGEDAIIMWKNSI